ncbi:ubiquitin family protein [Ancylostoma ceylanicum]|uniref:Ubiquitin family protein n=1 Tax=Ancylostoma ceylanicum TaxID=53326 RepID=A0A0D6LR80_9BILA|nr:ubiquitin family protein [Ancylostoma ceylanicum]
MSCEASMTVLQLGQEFRPRGSWGDVMTRMRTRARTHSQTNGESDSSAPRHRISDTNVVIQSPATVMDDSSASSDGEDAPASTSTDAQKAEEPPIVEIPPQVENPVEVEGDSVIRLKFLDDTQRDARTTMTDTIGKFKSVHFGDAVAAGRVVRLIYQGQLLREDSRTLASYGLRDGCVVHCHISNTPYSTQGPSTSQPVTTATQLRHRDTTRATTATTPNNRQEANEFRYPRWAVALLLYTYRFPIIGLPLDAIVRFLFDRQAEDNTQPGVVRRAYRRLLSAIYREGNADETSPLDRAADAAARVPPQRLCLGDYLLWIFAGQFVAVWGFVYAFPQLCDHTALGLLVLLTLYFFFVKHILSEIVRDVVIAGDVYPGFASQLKIIVENEEKPGCCK